MDKDVYEITFINTNGNSSTVTKKLYIIELAKEIVYLKNRGCYSIHVTNLKNNKVVYENDKFC